MKPNKEGSECPEWQIIIHSNGAKEVYDIDNPIFLKPVDAKEFTAIHRGAYDKALSALREAVEALKSIACQDKPDQTKQEYWREFTNECNAEVLANDTIISRETLTKIKAEFPEVFKDET